MTTEPNCSDNSTDIETLAEQFVEQLHAGETPTIKQYIQEYPALADEIRDLFPTILNMETSLEELFTQIESNRRPGQKLDPKQARGMLDALGRMLRFYEQLAEQTPGGLESQIRVAEALRRMGDLHRSLREYDDAETVLLRALASLTRLIADTPGQAQPHIQHARANYTLGRVYHDTGRLDEGDTLIQFAITELESLPNDAPQRRHIQELLSRFRRDMRRTASE